MTRNEMQQRYAAGEKNFAGVDLRGVDLRGVDLCGVDLSGVDLSGANLSGADLFKANLSGADLSNANLHKEFLYSANLYEANLSGADLSEANLSGAKLFKANLSGADLSGADLCGTDLFKADLSGADLKATCLDPERDIPDVSDEAIIAVGLELDADQQGHKIVRGWRTVESQLVSGHNYSARGWYIAPWFSVAPTACHPGIYLASQQWLANEYPGARLVACWCYRDEIHCAIGKWRTPRLFSEGVPEMRYPR